MKSFWGKMILLIALVGVSNAASFAQIKAKTDCPDEAAAKAKTVAFVDAAASKAKAVLVEAAGHDSATEKAIATTERPTISLCVTQGTVRVRGWQRKEVRAMVDGGSGLGFKVVRRDGNNDASWVMLLGYDLKNNEARRKDQCLSGYNIELEVPLNASVDIKSKDDDVNIESVAKASVRNFRGDIVLRDITEKAEVSSLSGSILAEDSTGEFVLKSTTGSVTANRLKPLNVTDALRVKSDGGGNITLQDISHTNIDANSPSGDLIVFSPLVSGGNYSLATTSSNIKLFLPVNSSFQFVATMSQPKKFQSDLKLKITNQNAPDRSKRISGTYGSGDATINLTTFNGSILLLKQ
jgi:hypothetical protein